MGSSLLAPFALGVLLTSGPAPVPPAPDDQDAGATSELRFQAHKDWKVDLPSETWKPTTHGIQIGGVEFAVRRAGLAKIDIDTTGDGRHDTTIKGVAGFAVLRGRTSEGEAVEYAVRLRNDGKAWTWSSSGTLTGRVRGETVHLIDQDGDGRHDGFGSDAMIVGQRLENAFLLSKVVNLGGSLYHFELEGTQVTTRPYVGETARLEVASGWQGKGKLTSAVFADRSSGVSFDPLGARDGLLVPAGTYAFVSGMAVGQGESVRMRAGRLAPLTLAAGEARSMTWGGPVTMVFDYDAREEEVTVKADLRFFGEAGEEYHTFLPEAKSPKILIHDKKSGKLVRSGRFGGC